MSNEELKIPQKISDEAMEDISGGSGGPINQRDGMVGSPFFNKNIIVRKCADCGKEFKCYTKSIFIAENMVTTWRRDWYSHFCFECAKKHPYTEKNHYSPEMIVALKLKERAGNKPETISEDELKRYNELYKIWAD